jgi:hypothetical protein
MWPVSRNQPLDTTVYQIIKSMTQNREGRGENKPEDFDMFSDAVSQ